MSTILILGAADTGRAPMTAAMLRQILAQRQLTYEVASAGILGHDGDSPTSEAIATMDQMGLDITDYTARSLTEELAAEASILIAVDSGTARVAQARFPAAAERIITLGILAGRTRDIPDPFKMPISAWLTYASEIQNLLRSALPRLLTTIGHPSNAAASQPMFLEKETAPAPARVVLEMPHIPSVLPEATAPGDTGTPHVPQSTEAPAIAEARQAALSRSLRLCDVIEQLPAIIDWRAARSQLEDDLERCQIPSQPDDLAPALVGLLRAALALTPGLPNTSQLAALREALHLLQQPVGQPHLAAFSIRIGMWQQP
jgi:protein-tyrosine phosphatase